MAMFATGTQVIVTSSSAKNGYPRDQQIVRECLQIGGVYTIEWCYENTWYTNVGLVGFSHAFNSVNFERYESKGLGATSVKKITLHEAREIALQIMHENEKTLQEERIKESVFLASLFEDDDA